jgi:hypothetical protein
MHMLTSAQNFMRQKAMENGNGQGNGNGHGQMMSQMEFVPSQTYYQNGMSQYIPSNVMTMQGASGSGQQQKGMSNMNMGNMHNGHGSQHSRSASESGESQYGQGPSDWAQEVQDEEGNDPGHVIVYNELLNTHQQVPVNQLNGNMVSMQAGPSHIQPGYSTVPMQQMQQLPTPQQPQQLPIPTQMQQLPSTSQMQQLLKKKPEEKGVRSKKDPKTNSA